MIIFDDMGVFCDVKKYLFEDHLSCHLNKEVYTMDIVTKMRWNCLKETVSLFARENELGDPLDVALKLTSKIVDGQNHMK